MLKFRLPEAATIASLIKSWHREPLSYHHLGGVLAPPELGFIFDVHRVYLGRGPEIYQAANAALDAWVMFPAWAVIYPQCAPQHVGSVVAMVTRICGLWWINPCRILHRSDSELTHGFVYGTLSEHAESGEERFMVEQLSDGSVWYEIRAFSRPRHWLAWLGFPLARWWQCRFVRDSQMSMLKSVA